MELEKIVDNIGTQTDIKRVASAYVIDYRNLTEDELRKAIKKTAPQYYYRDNVSRALRNVIHTQEHDRRSLASLFLKRVLLHKDGFSCEKRETEDDIIKYEQDILDRSNEDLGKNKDRTKSLDFFSFMVETAWQRDDDITLDEHNLITKVRERLHITEREHQIIEAKLGKFPKPGNVIHSRGEIEDVRKLLQSQGLVFIIRDENGNDFDVIPVETAKVLREILGIEIRRFGYKELLSQKYVRNKKYLTDVLTKCDVVVDQYATLDEIKEMCIEQIKPSVVLGGLSPRDGLEIGDLKKWCAEISVNVSGLKADMIERIVGFYDNLIVRDEAVVDERELWYKHFAAFAQRDLGFLRAQQLIGKDIDCERRFEEATSYLFERRLLHKPLQLIGSARPDGAISFQDKLILWDNKSKETPVNLKDHIKQFDSYIRTSEKRVACFLVIAPDFTPDSSVLAMQYQVETGTTLSLITAQELWELAETWATKNSGKQGDPFPLGYLIQPGRFNRALVAAF